MKNCPYCNSAIEENAQICLYCMKELKPKARIGQPLKKKKTRILFTIGTLIIVLLIFVSAPKLLSLIQNELKNESDVNGNIIPEQSTSEERQESEINQENSDSVPESNSAANTEKVPEINQQNTPSTNDIYENKNQNDVPPMNSDNNASDNTEDIVNKPKIYNITPSEEYYQYRDAEYGIDDYYIASNVKNCVVITGVSKPSENGVYHLPETLGGKRVIAVGKFAFNTEGIAETVKEIHFPPSIVNVQEYSFSKCVNLTDVYYHGEAIHVDVFAYPMLERRQGQLTIHCSDTCTNRDLRYHKNIADDYYDAFYEEWSNE